MVGGEQTESGAALLREVNAKALMAHRAGRSEEALQVFASLIKAAPSVAVFHNNRAAILVELGRDAEALPDFERAIALDPHHVEAQIGLGGLLWRAGDTGRALACYRIAAADDPKRLDAHLAIFELAQIAGDRDAALAHQREALAIRRTFTDEATTQPARRRVLVIKTPGDWQANLPVEYVLNRETNTIHTWFADAAELANPSSPVPDHDIIFNVVAETEEAIPVLDAIGAFARRRGVPLLNQPAHILRAARDRFPELLSGIPRCIAPVPRRVSRSELATGRLAPTLANFSIEPPFLLRPITSQAGRDLIRVEDPAEVAPYLAGLREDSFFLSKFIDYAGADGFYRKYRIIFVDGEPFPYHLALSPNWMVHYYNAGMRENAARRQEEARFLGDLGAAFDAGLQDALRRLAEAIDLDYFGIDCTVTPNNELLVFEVETGMIVHNFDPVDIYPYKPAAYTRIAEALERMLERRTRRAAA